MVGHAPMRRIAPDRSIAAMRSARPRAPTPERRARPRGTGAAPAAGRPACARDRARGRARSAQVGASHAPQPSASARRSTRAPSETRSTGSPVVAPRCVAIASAMPSGVSVAEHEPHVERVLARVVVRDLGQRVDDARRRASKSRLGHLHRGQRERAAQRARPGTAGRSASACRRRAARSQPRDQLVLVDAELRAPTAANGRSHSGKPPCRRFDDARAIGRRRCRSCAGSCRPARSQAART